MIRKTEPSNYAKQPRRNVVATIGTVVICGAGQEQRRSRKQTQYKIPFVPSSLLFVGTDGGFG